MKLKKPKVTFEVDGKKIEFEIVHNLPKTKGLDFDSALNNWLARTSEYTDISLVDYINKKMLGTDYFAMTWDVFNQKS